MILDYITKRPNPVTYKFEEIEPPHGSGQAVKIYALNNDEIIAEYIREFTKPINEAHYWNFIGKFTRDTEYRKTFKTSGEWN